MASNEMWSDEVKDRVQWGAFMDDLELFDEGWKKIDDEAKGYIITDDLITFLLNVQRPLRPLGIPYGDTPEHRAAARVVGAAAPADRARVLADPWARRGVSPLAFVPLCRLPELVAGHRRDADRGPHARL